MLREQPLRDGSAVSRSAVSGPAARRARSCSSFRTRSAPAKPSALIEMESKNSRDLGTSSSHSLVAIRQ